MIKEVKNVEDANKCDELLTKLILDEKKYNDLIDDNIVIKNHFSKMLDDEDAILLAYYLDKLIVGYILIRKINENLCLLDGLYVLEEYRNQKIASSLLNEAIDRCKKLNVKYIDINVMEKNELAKRIGKSRTHITNTLRLLNLPEKIQEYVLDGSLSMGHARALITLDKERALKIAKRVIDEKLSVRDVENIVKGFELQEARKNKPKVEKSKEYQYVEGLLRKKYRTRIKVDDKSITIKYSDTDDLNRLLELMGVIEES